MNRLDIYYRLKPFVPRPLLMRMRRFVGRRMRPGFSECWPILERAGTVPEGWTGWPDGRSFAVVLTHDVETKAGLSRCGRLMDMEERLGFRSSFNFVPEKRYRVAEEVRRDLAGRGFEVGIHGLRHDGWDFRSRRVFERRVGAINGYLKAWGCSGFRAPSMRGNLDWIRELAIEYDSSTFDTDPFEPQPHGAQTIFPFLVDGAADGAGYVEMPYTLPQDFTLFVLLHEKDVDIWKNKVDWIAEKGGMVLLDTHPDYMAFDGKPKEGEYPASFYEDLLLHIKTRYKDRYWHPLPRDMARFWRESCRQSLPPARNQLLFDKVHSRRKRIWIDLDNTPHVPFFRPIIRELRERDWDVLVTVRDAFQACELADRYGMSYIKVGSHHGKNKLLKLAGLIYRTLQMIPVVAKDRPVLAVSHGSRSQIMLANLLDIPSVLIEDYEFARFLPIMRPRWAIAPELIPGDTLPADIRRVLKYPGIKEDVYVPFFKPDAGILKALGIVNGDIVATVRPPATEAHYHNPESEELFHVAVEKLLAHPNVRIILLPRNQRQAEWIRKKWPGWFLNGRVIVPGHVVDGLNVLWHSDLVISGGGTMNREAAALGVPVYSIFRGKIGAVDRHLAQSHRLTLIESVEDLDRKLRIERREKGTSQFDGGLASLRCIVDHIVALAEQRQEAGG